LNWTTILWVGQWKDILCSRHVFLVPEWQALGFLVPKKKSSKKNKREKREMLSVLRGQEKRACEQWYDERWRLGAGSGRRNGSLRLCRLPRQWQKDAHVNKRRWWEGDWGYQTRACRWFTASTASTVTFKNERSSEMQMYAIAHDEVGWSFVSVWMCVCVHSARVKPRSMRRGMMRLDRGDMKNVEP